ncbi:MAG: nitronate monooxygenase family protein [Flavobacteriaceae bacterium]|jgi:nitronate monooxygenase|nr:nitronate monooxygenase family protein [Flavobacteriaceae bacterium]
MSVSLNNTINLPYAVMQCPMLGVTTPAMVACVSNNGGIGSLPLGGTTAEQADKLISETKSLTNRPFIANLFLHPIVEIQNDNYIKAQKKISQLTNDIGFDYTLQTNFNQISYKDLLPILKKYNVKLIAFTFGCLTEDEIHTLHNDGCTLIGTATTIEEVTYLKDHKIDIILLQGIEAGGHRGSFLEESETKQLSLKDLFEKAKSLYPNIPYITVGGLKDGEEGKMYLDKGALMAGYGSLFLASEESDAPNFQKNILAKGLPLDTVLTKAFSGKWARGIKNDFITQIESLIKDIPPFPIQNQLTGQMRVFAKENNFPAFYSMWSGVNGHYAQKKRTEEIFNQLIKEIYG